MTRKEQYANFLCGYDGCKNYGHYVYNNKQELSSLSQKYAQEKYRCVRHTEIDEVLKRHNEWMKKEGK